ncbi:MAG: 30S ribosomal protein S4 [Solirubrobacterales bacterium]
MGRYTGPVERLSRREGVDLELKGARRFNGKSALDRRGAIPPGQHGMRRGGRASVYAAQLREKQRAKRYYGLRENQFRRLYKEASRSTDSVTGEKLLQLLELRLDNALYRMGFASTRAQARQFVGHQHVLVNGERCDIASRRVAEGDIITIVDGSPIRPLAIEATTLVSRVSPWLEVDHDGLSGKVVRLPQRADIQVPIEEHLIVELYSRV